MATRRNPLTGPTIAERLRATRALTLDLAAPLSDADATIQPFPDASPAKWHLAHTTWFFETFVLRDHVPGYQRFDERYHFLFNSYYEGEGERHPRPKRGMLSRPSLDEVREWRSHVDEALERALPGLSPGALELVEREGGFTYGAKRSLGGGRSLWRVNQFIMPFYTMPPTDVTASTTRTSCPPAEPWACMGLDTVRSTKAQSKRVAEAGIRTPIGWCDRTA